MSYDANERRDTPLALKLKERIRQTGPMSVRAYMEACLHDPEHGYYRTKTAVGAAGDFVTAPEITQIFGELIGLWAAVVWQQMGAHSRIILVELGPGRGTLMRDALHAARVVPGFLKALSVHLVETSVPLREAQRATLVAPARTIEWHDRLEDVPEGPAILIANEFLDTLPLDQLVGIDAGWARRGIGLSNGAIAFVNIAEPCPETTLVPRPGGVCERQDFSSLAGELFRRAKSAPLAALFLDYGHVRTSLGDTLQAVRQHRFEHPLCSPGEADLTCQVDFDAFARSFESAGGHGNADRMLMDGPVSQAEFLSALGILERASRLMAANPGKAGTIETAVARLLSPTGMGERFKAVGVRSRGLPALPGFAVDTAGLTP